MQKGITGIVLSGGKSRRMGQEKGLVSFQGKALVEYPIQVLKPICEEVLLSTANSAYQYLGLPLVQDEVPDCGPMGGIASCMNYGRGDYFFVISCDVPFAPTELFEYLYQQRGEYDAIVPIGTDGRKQPLCALFARKCLPKITEAVVAGNFKMMHLLDNLDVKYIYLNEDLPFFSDRLFANVNSPSDLDSH